MTAQRPDSAETRSLTRFVTTRLRPALTAGSDFSSDTDDLDALRSYLAADYSLAPDRSVTLHLGRDLLRAPRGSGLERIDGRRKARHEEAWLGYRQRFTLAWPARCEPVARKPRGGTFSAMAPSWSWTRTIPWRCA